MEFFSVVFIGHGATAIDGWLYDKHELGLIVGIMFYAAGAYLFYKSTKTK